MKIGRRIAWCDTDKKSSYKGEKIMKKHSVRLASLVLFFATGAAIGMEYQPKVLIQNEAWGYGLSGGYYDLKVSINDSQEEIQVKGGETAALGNLNNIDQIKIRRSGSGSSWIPSMIGVSTITAEELNNLKAEANEPTNLGKDVVLIIGATTTGYAMLSHFWGVIKFVKNKPIIIDKSNPWSVFPIAEKAKQALNVDNFSANLSLSKLNFIQQQNLITVAKLIFGFNADDKPDKIAINKRYRELSLRLHPDKVQDLTASMVMNKFQDEVFKIVGRANEILQEAYELNLI